MKKRISLPDEHHLTLLGRLASLRYIRPLISLIVEASPPLVLASVTLRIFKALTPIAALWIPKLILDRLVHRVVHHTGSLNEILNLLALELVVAALSDILGRCNTLCDSLLGDRFTNLVTVKLMRHASTLDLPFFEDPVFYDKLDRARKQTTGRLTLLAYLLNVCQDTVTLIVFSVGLLFWSPWLMVLLLLSVLPSFLGETHISTLAYSVTYKKTPQRRILDYLRLLGSSAQTAREIKIFGLGDHLIGRYRNVSEDIYSENKRIAIRRAAEGSLLNIVSTFGYYAAYAVTILHAAAGSISIGTFAFLTGSFARSRTLIERIFDNVNDISDQAVFLKDLFDFLDLRPTIRAASKAKQIPRPIQKGFEFRNVGFAYAGSQRMVVKNLNFRLLRGEKVALVGENGAGKSTIVKLLTRLYDPTEGQILLDGIDLREFDPAELHSQIGVIFQDYIRYDMPARENIGFGRLEWMQDDERLHIAAHKGLATELIGRYAKGFDQMLGRRFEGGVDLSGGEWQKLALARAYMRDAQLVILDEPTATLDARAELQIFRRLAKMTEGRMAVLISHRFSTVRMADRILVLADGEIKEEGTHKELIDLNGPYAELFELQAAGYR